MLVAGIDSSTQACKVLIVDSVTGETVRSGKVPHPDGTEIDPNDWWQALIEAIKQAGGLDDVAAVSIAGQQHGMILLDENGAVVRPALTWNDTRSADAAKQLIAEFGADLFASKTGIVPVASFTASKLKWVLDNEPQNAEKTAAVCLPHDYLTWRLRGFGPQNNNLEELITDQSDVSGTAYWGNGSYCNDIFKHVFGRDLREAGSPALKNSVIVPRVLNPGDKVKSADGKLDFGPGAGDNAAAGLGLNCMPGDAVMSLGTSGVVFGSSSRNVFDPTGIVAGFRDCNDNHLPLICTLNGARILQAGTKLLSCNYAELEDLALQAPPGSNGLVLVPYFEGERTPNLPQAKARLENMSLTNCTRENTARAFVEALLCSMSFGLSAIEETTGAKFTRIVMIGGASINRAVQECARSVFNVPIIVPSPAEYVARGAAVQAAWALSGKKPDWTLKLNTSLESTYEPRVFQQYKAAAEKMSL